jgi:penicillin amidase
VQGIRAVAVAAAALALSAAAPAHAAITRAESSLPPGESGFVSIAGVQNGTGSPHLYDQNSGYIHFRYKNAQLGQAGSVDSPKTGVTIVRDGFGVPSIRANNASDLWWGAGYATAQDRLFQLELFRRATTGHLSEILGKDYLPMDIEVRRDFYTPEEIDSLIPKLPAEFVQRYRDYAAGINAWVSHVGTTPTDMPAEFVALADPPQPFTIEQLAAIGIYLARTTPNGDGIEFDAMRALKASGKRALNRILPLRIPGQISTVPRSSGLFSSVPGRTRKQERAGLTRSAKFVRNLPLPPAGDLGTEPSYSAPASQAARSLIRPIRLGGSYMAAIGDRRHHRAVFFNGPELGYTAPEELYELELQGPGLNVRGITAPGAPVIAIGHNKHVAFGLTSGLSGTNALYAEKLVPGHPNTYYFHGKPRPMSCRQETFQYRSSTTSFLDIPPPPPQFGSQTYTLCRTVHGPVQARVGGYAYARRYATWMREVNTIVGLSQVDTARNIADVSRAMSHVTWNENLMAADDRGSIGYWHPGLIPVRPKNWDERLPYPGDGRAEWRGFLSVARRPHVINPRQHWLTNWNNIPSQGWTTQNAPATERVAGRWFRIRWFNRQIAPMARHFSYAGLKHAVQVAGTTAEQRPFSTHWLKRALHGADARAAAVLRAILRWKGSYNQTDSHGTVAPGLAAWQALKRNMQLLAIRPLGAAGRIIGDEQPNSEHVFDVSLGQAYAFRRLGPASVRLAATRTSKQLTARFHTSNTSKWREPRTMAEWSTQGAESPPPMPFFDRGTFEEFLELKG